MKKDEEISTLIKYRLEQAQTALEDAKFLFEAGRSPQSTVNRAYYAMFYAVLALLQKIGRVPSKHTGAISIFDSEFVMTGVLPKKLSRDLHKAFELRQTLDYRTFEAISPDRADEILDKATQFLEAVKNHLEDPTK